MDSIAEVLGTAAVRSWTIMRTFALRLWQHVIGFSQELQAIGFDILPSKTNFVLVKPHGVTAGQLFAYLQSKKIYVRYFPRWSVFQTDYAFLLGRRMRWSAY